MRADLRPYVCLSADCGLSMFEDLHSWHTHEMEQHQRFWSCRLCKRSKFDDSSSLLTHLQDLHSFALEEEHVDSILSACSQPKTEMHPQECLLCDWTQDLRQINAQTPSGFVLTVTTTQFMKHLASHQEQLALFALPRVHREEADSNAAESHQVHGASSREMVRCHLSGLFFSCR